MSSSDTRAEVDTRALATRATRGYRTSLALMARVLGTLIGVSVVVFLMLRAIPGDQISAFYGTAGADLSPEQIAALRADYGLDDPLFLQYLSWLGKLFTGDLGYSTLAQKSVGSLLLAAAPVTLELTVLSMMFALVLGIPLGMWAASRVNGLRDWSAQLISILGLSLPVFVLGSILLTVTARSFGFNPNGKGYAKLFDDPVLNLQQMLLPSLVLGFNISAALLRTTRTAVLEVRSADFVRTVRAKGVPSRRLNLRHIFRNASIPVLTMTSLQVGYLLGGTIVIEKIFALPGVGSQLLISLEKKEYPVAQTLVVTIAAAFVAVNLLTDILYRVVDPRIRR